MRAEAGQMWPEGAEKVQQRKKFCKDKLSASTNHERSSSRGHGVPLQPLLAWLLGSCTEDAPEGAPLELFHQEISSERHRTWPSRACPAAAAGPQTQPDPMSRPKGFPGLRVCRNRDRGSAGFPNTQGHGSLISRFLYFFTHCHKYHKNHF